ncbi:N-acetyltransferase [Desulfobacula sp.]|uniref:GNAT family N-acetyltransferase n=1 Tax=Desulfobacula sp. TaxID=2593537 RepID=UPI002623ED10|nr:N-acetyltransferase [Desulfobacula sp.]
MKIRKLTTENYPKVSALLQQAFPDSRYEVQLVESFHKNGTPVHEWVCLHTNRVIAYIAFSNAYDGPDVCGLHLAPLAVTPAFQNQGIGSELLRFALRQTAIKENTLFVLGNPEFYQKFGFVPCAGPICPFDKNNAHFLSLGNTPSRKFTVGYEPEFSKGKK